MKFSVYAKQLSAILPSPSAVKSLGGDPAIVIRAHGGSVTVTVGAGESSLAASCPAERVMEEGAIAVSPDAVKKLAQVLRKSPGIVEVRGIAGELASITPIANPSASVRLLTEKIPDDFTEYREDLERAELPADGVRNVLGMAKNFADSEARERCAPYICVSYSPKGADVVWTDGVVMHMLAAEEYPSLGLGRVIIPTSCLKSVLDLAKPRGGELVVGAGVLRCGDVRATFPPPKGDGSGGAYPDVRLDRLPRGETVVECDAEALRTGLKEISAYISGEVVIRAVAKRGVNLMGVDPIRELPFEASPRAETWIDGQVEKPAPYRGYDAAFCVDVRYLTEILRGASGRVRIACKTPYDPLHITVESSAISTALMPMSCDWLYKSV